MATGSSIRGSISQCSLSISDFNEVATACENVCHEWEELAKHLNIDRVTVLSIQKERGGHSLIYCLDKLLTTWLRQPSPTQPKPSWRILRDAVARVDRPLSETIWTKHISNCDLCCADTLSDGDIPLQQQPVVRTPLHTLRHTPVAKAVQKQNAVEAANKLKKDFKELAKFLITEISNVNVEQLRYEINDHFQEEEGTIDEELEKHLMKIEDCDKPSAILNYFRRHRFIGYINYSLVKVFQQLAKSPLLDKRIEQYEKDYQCFLELSLSQIHDAFHQCADLCPDYPAGIPKFTIHLQSEWDGKSMLDLKEFLKKCFANSDHVDQLMIAKIIRNCIIVTFAVPPHIAREVLRYLTNNDIIMSMKKEGISIEISNQLMKYKELKTASMEQTSGTLLTNRSSYFSQSTGMLAIKRDWDTLTVTDITSGYGDSETSESRMAELDDVTMKETVDAYEKVVDMLQKYTSLESQLMTSKQMMMELDNTRDELKMATQALTIADPSNIQSSKVVLDPSLLSTDGHSGTLPSHEATISDEDIGIKQKLMMTEAKLEQKNAENNELQENLIRALTHLEKYVEMEANREDEIRKLHQQLETESILKKEAVDKLTQIMYQQRSQLKKGAVSSRSAKAYEHEIRKLKGELQALSLNYKHVEQQLKEVRKAK